MRDLTKKTLFLVALATANRVGELQPLSYTVARQGKDLFLAYLPEFMAKTETDINPVSRELYLHSLSTLVGREDEECLLCPVRVLTWYWHMAPSTTRPRHLFIFVRDQKKPMSKAAIYLFLQETNKTAQVITRLLMLFCQGTST